MPATIRGGPVLDHGQRFCDRVVAEVAGINAAPDFGTRPDHKPTRDRAVDIFVPVNETGRIRGEAICALAIANVDRDGVRYVIFRQRIWHRNDRRWVPMEDRGAPGPDTQDHYDHVHVSFEATAPAEPNPPPTTTPAPTEEEWMSLDPAKSEELYETTKATNAAVGRLEVAVRDQTSGLVAKLDELIAKIDAVLANEPDDG